MDVRTALISVFDKTGIVEFAQAVHQEFGIEIISTGGTARTLQDAGIPVTSVEEITGFPEMMDGRVKTLHPKIHAGILADRDNPEHMRQLAEQGIKPIDMVVANLYPFEQTIAKPDCSFADAIEMIDIGGPSMIRAAAKNHKHVFVLPRSNLLHEYLAFRRETDPRVKPDARFWRAFRESCASIAFDETNRYDRAITAFFLGKLSRRTNEHFGRESITTNAALPSVFSFANKLESATRYGENPHQQGGIYSLMDFADGFKRTPLFAEGMSYNNYVDADAALRLCRELSLASSMQSSPQLENNEEAQACTTKQSGGQALSLSEGDPAADRKSRGQRQTIQNEESHRRNLPHIQRPDATVFLTFRLASNHLTESERDVVIESLLTGEDLGQYALHAAVVMPDHVHVLLTPLEQQVGAWTNVSVMIKGIKGATARRINELRGTTGALWQDEYWDTIVRDNDHLQETVGYILENAARKGLVAEAEEYSWCIVDAEIGWDTHRRIAGVAARYSLQIGNAPQLAEKRRWHEQLENRSRLIIDPNSASTMKTAADKSAESSDRLRACPPQQAEPSACPPQPAAVGQRSFSNRLRHTCTFIKHTNACGVGVAADAVEAYRRAYLGDPNAAMGGILACDFPITAAFAATVLKTYQTYGKPLKDAGAKHAPGGFFVEVWIAPHFTKEACALIRGRDIDDESCEEFSSAADFAKEFPNPPKKPWGERVRLVAAGEFVHLSVNDMQYRTISGGMLVQTPDDVGLAESEWQIVSKRKPTDSELVDLCLAWLTCKHTKSNAITICKDGMLLGNGAGQMSRVMSCRIATWLAKENGHEAALADSAAASDAFFPFADGPQILLDAGVTAIIQPGGSKRDDETIKLCDERDATLIFTGTRHFLH